MARLPVVALALSVLAAISRPAAAQAPSYVEASSDAPHATILGQVTRPMGMCPRAGGRAICSARLDRVDGKVTTSNSTSTRVESGKRQLSLVCSY